MRWICLVILFDLIAFARPGSAQAPGAKLAAADLANIKAANQAYAAAWLANDSAAVMRLLSSDAVLIPQGSHAIAGTQAIKQFWWPSGGKTTVTAFTITTEEIGGECGVAYVRGSFVLSLAYADSASKFTRTNHGNYLMMMRRQSDGGWQISHRMWSDLPQGK